MSGISHCIPFKTIHSQGIACRETFRFRNLLFILGAACICYTRKTVTISNPWTKDVNWTYIRSWQEVLDLFWTSYVRSTYVLCPGDTIFLSVISAAVYKDYWLKRPWKFAVFLPCQLACRKSVAKYVPKKLLRKIKKLRKV